MAESGASKSVNFLLGACFSTGFLLKTNFFNGKSCLYLNRVVLLIAVLMKTESIYFLRAVSSLECGISLRIGLGFQRLSIATFLNIYIILVD